MKTQQVLMPQWKLHIIYDMKLMKFLFYYAELVQWSGKSLATIVAKGRQKFQVHATGFAGIFLQLPIS